MLKKINSKEVEEEKIPHYYNTSQQDLNFGAPFFKNLVVKPSWPLAGFPEAIHCPVDESKSKFSNMNGRIHPVGLSAKSGITSTPKRPFRVCPDRPPSVRGTIVHQTPSKKSM